MAFDNILTGFDERLSYIFVGAMTFFTTLYLFCKSLNIRLKKSQVLLSAAIGAAVALFYMFLKESFAPLSQLLLYFIIPIILSLTLKRDKMNLSLVVGLISLSFVHVLKMLSTVAAVTCFWIAGYTKNSIFVYLAIMTLAFVICALFMRIKRFRRGFGFFQKEEHLGLGLALSGIVFTLTSIDYFSFNNEAVFFALVIMGVFISGFGLYLWIRRSITAHYRERLQLKSEEHYRELLGKSEAENEALIRSNEFLAKVVHRDNHLISSLSSSIDAYFESPDKAFKDELLRGIQTLAKERSELIDREQLESKLLPATGSPMLDGAINELYIKAAAHGIDFNLNVSAAPDEIIGKYISLTELQTLLCDHIKDAIIAVDEEENERGKILVNLSMNNGCYEIGIFDSGVDFEIETLSKLGIERSTTHPDSGGSGIGFMTTFETLGRAYASLIITELENKTPFSKSVVFRFDGENSFVIKSPRAEELREKISRKDVTII